MTGRTVGAIALLTLLAAIGAGVGYLAGPEDVAEVGTTSFGPPEPLPAAKPSLPVEIFRADPDDPALETAIPLRTERLATLGDDGEPSREQLSVPVPQGWAQTRPTGVRWQFVVPGNDDQSYGLRIDLLADSGLSVQSAKQRRESELKSAKLQDSFSDLEITEDNSDGFTAVYVQDGYQRYSIERFYPGPDPDRVFASVAVYGRARDVTGLNDLIERISIGLRPIEVESTD